MLSISYTVVEQILKAFSKDNKVWSLANLKRCVSVLLIMFLSAPWGKYIQRSLGKTQTKS